jgi:hypothetical protein
MFICSNSFHFHQKRSLSYFKDTTRSLLSCNLSSTCTHYLLLWDRLEDQKKPEG